MAMRCTMRLDYVDVATKRLYRKLAKNRPLGDIEAKHNFVMSEPTLAVHPIDVDLYQDSVKPYKILSANEMIEDQHRIMHLQNKQMSKKMIDDYLQGDTVSAPAKRAGLYASDRRPKSSKRNIGVNLTITGTGTSDRPTSSPERSVRKSATTRKKRPNTTGNVKVARSDFMTIKVDPEIVKSTRKYQSTTDEIRRKFEEVHNISEGIYARGKKQPCAAMPGSADSSEQWLTFGGGSVEESAGGVIDAFTNMKEPEEYYIVDGNHGSHLAKKIQFGDKLRIGKNGIVHATDLKIKKENDNFFIDELIEEYEEYEPQKQIVPLCWDDQMAWESAKVIKSSGPKEYKPKPNLCESHPIKFEKLIKDDSTRLKSSQKGRYRVKSGKKGRKDLLGEEASMVEITIDNIDNDGISDCPSAETYEEIVDRAVLSSRESNRKHSPKHHLKTYQYPRWQENEQFDNTSPRDCFRSASKLSMTESTVNAAAEMRQYIQRQVSTPMHRSSDPELSIVAPGQKDKQITGEIDRSPTPIRPTAASPLHKTNARTGASISVNGQQTDKEYIKITTSLKTPVYSNQNLKPRMPSSRTTSHIAISHIEEMNRNYYDPNRLDLDNTFMENYIDMYDKEQQRPYSRFSMAATRSDASARLRANTPVESYASSGQKMSRLRPHVSVNIPTAGISGASSDINSMSDFQEFENQPTQMIGGHHAPIPEEPSTYMTRFKGQSRFRPTSARSGASSRAFSRPDSAYSAQTLPSSGDYMSRPSTAASLRSDIDSNDLGSSSQSRRVLNAQVDDVTSMLDDTGIGSSQTNTDPNNNNNADILDNQTVVSPETEKLLESVSTRQDEKSGEIQKIFDEKQKQEPVDPETELKILRDQIKKDLNDTQKTTELDIQNLHLKQGNF